MHRSLITVATLLLSPFIHLSLAQIATAPSDSTPNSVADIRADDRTIDKMGADAVRQGGIKFTDIGPGKISWIELAVTA